jgi:hypothetical protein
MAFTYDGESPESRESDDTDGVKTYSREYKFTASSQSDDEATLLAHASAPQYGSVHPNDSGAWVNSRKGKCTTGYVDWRLFVTWSSKRELAVDPTTEPAIITVSTEQFQKVADKDTDGKAICNSAGDPFDPPYMMDDSRRVIHVSKNMSGHPAWLLDYQDMVNSDSFSIKGVTYAAGVGKLQRVTIGEDQTRNGVPFVVVQLEIHCQREGWHLEPLDAGFRQLAYDGLTRINIYNSPSTTNENGASERISSPAPLDGVGQALADPDTNNCIFLDYTVYKTDTFAALPLT